MGLGVFGQGLYINPTRRIVTVRYSSLPAHSIIEYSKGWNEIRLWMDETAKLRALNETGAATAAGFSA